MLESPIDAFVDRLSTRTLLTDEERHALALVDAEVRLLAPNRELIGIGERVEHIDMVLSGVAARFELTSQGARQITALHLPGEAANPRSLIQPASRSGYVALTPTKVARVSITALRRVAARFPAVTEAFWREADADAEIVIQWLVNTGRRDSKARLAHLFCELAMRSGFRPQDTEAEFEMPLTQEHLADVTGLTPVHVNRVLKILRDAKLLIVAGKTAHILDWQGLAEVGQFQPDYLGLPKAPGDR